MTESLASRCVALLNSIRILPRRIVLETPGVHATVPMLRGVWGAALHDLDPTAYAAVFAPNDTADGSNSRVPFRSPPVSRAGSVIEQTLAGSRKDHTPPAPVQAAKPDPAVAAVWAGFDPRILDYYREPGRFLEATVEPEHRSPGPGEPWWLEFRLTNRGPLPLALGADEAANPVFLVSVALEGERKREYPALLTVTLDDVRVLQPGRTARVRRTLDVGPLRDVSRRTPQQLQRVIVSTILDAQRAADGTWRAGPVGQVPRTVYFNRVPALSARESISSLVAALGGDNEAARWRALEVLADLLGEQQRAARQPPGYAPTPIAAERVQAVLRDALAAPAWETRARTLDALMVAGLDRTLLDAVQANATHPEWVVRLLALRVLARQGPVFVDAAREIARTDADELVRALATSYVAAWAGGSPSNEAVR